MSSRRPLRLNGHEFSTADATPDVDASDSNYIYIKGNGPIKGQQKQELADLGVFVSEFLGQDTYLCRYEPADLEPIRGLSFIEQANLYPRHLKKSTRLEDTISTAGAPDDTFTVDIILHKGETSPDRVVSDIVEKTGLNPEDISEEQNILRLTADAETIAKIQDVDAVKKIEKVIDKKFFNNFARQDIHADNKSGEEGPTSVPYNGKGETALISEGRKNDRGQNKGLTNDFDGHGTHCSGSVLGDGHSESMGGKIQGTAPNASLVVQSLLTSNGGLWTPPNLMNLFEGPYKLHDARISSNSWGLVWVKSQVAYDSEANATDGFVWHNQDHVIVFAAGNDGEEVSPNGAHIGSTSSAKNIICVGATQSSRPNGNYKYDPKKPAGDPSKVAGFSSLGPTLEGRVKPDVVAPGIAILSACSRDPKITDPGYAGFGFVDEGFVSGKSLAEDETWTKSIPLNVDVPATSGRDKQLKVTLVFSDRKGLELQNKLSLTVAVKDASGSTVVEKRGDEGVAEENNVEQVVLKLPEGSESVDVSVVCDRIARLNDKQAFAVAWGLYE
uniref:Peptidase S8/S53 domain-containing protein n=1 Tax=Bionectria ochroleuca TaxID=29856 RepID=A0A0B7KDM2_BIOOC